MSSPTPSASARHVMKRGRGHLRQIGCHISCPSCLVVHFVGDSKCTVLRIDSSGNSPSCGGEIWSSKACPVPIGKMLHSRGCTVPTFTRHPPNPQHQPPIPPSPPI